MDFVPSIRTSVRLWFCITPFNAMPPLCLPRFHARDQDLEYVHHFAYVGNYPIHVFRSEIKSRIRLASS